MEDICGIYKITSPSGKCYIGFSKHIHQRWQQEILAANNPNHHSYHTVLSKAIRKYKNELQREVLEECSIEKLPEREKYWIQFYDSFKNGYNMTPGGEGVSNLLGGDSFKAKLTNEDAIRIKALYKLGYGPKRLARDYPTVSVSAINHILMNETFQNITAEMVDNYINYLRENYHMIYQFKPALNGSLISAYEVLDIRTRYAMGETPAIIHKDYSWLKYNTIQGICGYRKWPQITREMVKEEMEWRR